MVNDVIGVAGDVVLDEDRAIALIHASPSVRPALSALWQLDARLRSIVLTVHEPMITRIKLAWWREALERLDTAPPPAEPLLTALAGLVLPRGVSGAELGRLEEAWSLAAGGAVDEADLPAFARGRASLFAMSARLLGRDEERFSEGEAWALADLARATGSTAPLAAAAALPTAQRRWPRLLRPLGMIHAAALRDVASQSTQEPQGAPGRVWRMLRVRLTGR